MYLGYVREDGIGPTKESQRDKLRAAGVNTADPQALYEDVLRHKKPNPKAEPPPLKERHDLLRALRPGDVLVVASPMILGRGKHDIMNALRAATDAGATVLDASTGVSVVMKADAEASFSFIDRAETERHTLQLEQMRRSKVAQGATGGRPLRLTGKRKTEAKKIWEDLTLSAPQAAAKAGASERTMYRLFGNRGVLTLPKGKAE